MKKYLLLFTSAALLLVGCAKEQIVDLQEGEMTNVTFTANLESGVATKAFADGDGNGTNVNRCIMEIYYGDTFYKRLVQPVETVGSKKVATFANVPVVAGKEYQILFWADNGSGTEGKDDQYYATTNLKTVTVKDAFIDALKSGNNDKLDAFFGNEKRTFTQQNDEVPILLKRPFAQLNVITTDVDTGKAVISADLLPGKVSVSYTAADSINVATGEVSGTKAYTYEASVYGKYDTWNNVKSRGELTLSMDYIFAEAEKRVIDVTFKTKNGDDVVMTHNLTNLPYQRNYRTNVKGDLLTVGGTWKATIDAGWTTPDYDIPFYVASSIQDAQNYISYQNDEQKKAVDLTQATISQSDVKEDKTIHFILRTTSPKDLVNFTLPAIPTTIQNCEGWTIEYENNYPTKNVGVNAPEGTKVKILAPTSHVNVTGTSYTKITALTGDNTLVIPQGVTVDSLIIKKGAVEIHGAVTNLSVNPAPIANTDPIKYEKVVFRACEGLSADVFAAIKGEDHDYIDPRYCAVEKATTPNTYDIVLATVATIGEKEYVTLAAAVAAVKNGETITLIKDVVLDKPIETNKTFTLTLNADITPVSGWQTNGNTDALVIINRGGNITINGTGKISSNGIANAYAAVKLTNKGESETGAAAKLTVDGNVILEGYYYGICGNGSRHNTEITVNGGTIKGMAANDNVGIYHPQKGKLTINGGTIEGASGIYVKSGDVEASINAGTIKGVGTDCKQYNPNRTGDGCDATGDAFVVDNCGYPGGEPTVEILGGTFISENYEAVGSYAKTGYSTVKSFIKGGTFSSDPWKYCAKGYASIEQDGKWIIVNAPKADVIKVHPDSDMTQTIPGSILEALGSNLFYKSEAQTPAGIPIPSVENGRMLLAEGYNGVFDLANGLTLNTVGKINGLDVCYIFAAKEDDDTQGEFDNWYADFVVSLDKDVNKDEIGLWGFYASWGVSMAFPAPQTIPAGKEVELLGILGDDGHSTFSYYDIKNTVKVFPCGAFKLSNNIKDATMKVDLRIYDPNDPNHEKYFVIESYEYKFTNETNAVISKEVNSQDELNTAIREASAGTEISIVAAGEYKLPASLGNITISGGVDGVEFDCVGTGSIASIPNGATFKNVKMKFGNTLYHGFQHSGRIIMEGCTLEGLFFGYGDMVFNDCTFKQPQSEYLMWTYGSEYLEFNNCKFDVAGKALNVYQENSPKDHVIIINNCEFKSSTANKPALAIKNNGNNGTGTTPIYYDITITKSTFEGFGQSDGDLKGFPSDAPYVNTYGYNHLDKPLKVTVDGEVRVNIPKN